ncbi:hypothetical protein CEXT_251441 [Caerostris extrusa]|uniref:Uncharacterized protein n=1 Tax=Caerostris extrusa TaxID=172846 RepID=A0AAV4NI22_CAEEX|nr:hypothetical protein CEXT_251441 [Caerostris extrusa]
MNPSSRKPGTKALKLTLTQMTMALGSLKVAVNYPKCLNSHDKSNVNSHDNKIDVEMVTVILDSLEEAADHPKCRELC